MIVLATILPTVGCGVLDPPPRDVSTLSAAGVWQVNRIAVRRYHRSFITKYIPNKWVLVHAPSPLNPPQIHRVAWVQNLSS